MDDSRDLPADAAASRKALSLIDAIYEAALDPEGWPGFLRALAAAYPGGQGTLYRMDGDRASVVLANWEEGWTRAHNEHFFDTNPWLDRMRARPAGVTNAAEDFVPAREFQNYEYYYDFLRPQGLATGVGATVARGIDSMVGVSVLFSNGVGQGATPEQVAHFASLVPHLRRAMRINDLIGRARLERAAAEQTLDRLGTGVVVANAECRCLFANAVAEGLLASRTSLSITPSRRLDAGSSARTSALRALVAQAARPAGRGASGGSVSVPRADAPDLLLLVTPLRILPDLLGFNDAAALIFIVDPAAKTIVQEQTVATLLGLTATQSRVACALARGARVEEIGGLLGVQDSTVRFHLRAIFERTKTSRQSDVVRLVLALSRGGVV